MHQRKISRRSFLVGAAITAATATAGAYWTYEGTKTPVETSRALTATSAATVTATSSTTLSATTSNTLSQLMLASSDELRTILFVGVQPFERFHQHMNKWSDVFASYHIRFLDRSTGFNDLGYPTGLDSETVSLAHGLNVYVASNALQDPQENGEWSFRRKYYDLLPIADRWTDADGTPQVDPYVSSGGRDINGSLLVTLDGYVFMSVCSPFWADYQRRSIEYFLDNGIDAIDIDIPQVVPSPLFATGDFSDWYLKSFREYLNEQYDSQTLRSWGIADPLAFDFKSYLKRRYISTATEWKGGDGHPFFTVDPQDKPLHDPLLRAWVKFSYVSLLDFHRGLSKHAKELGHKIGKQSVPYFGNLHLGFPLAQLSQANPSVILGQVMDIILIESVPALPPLRLTTMYKLGLAMGDYRKPVWGLNQAYYGYDFEPELRLSTDVSYVELLKLNLAEAYAAGAIPEINLGGMPGLSSPHGLFVTEDGDTLPAIMRYLDFVFEHQDLFIGTVPSSEVALVYSIPTFMWHDQPFWGIGHDDQTAAFVGFARAMEESQIPYDALIFGHPGIWDDAKALESLSHYTTVILPLVDCIDNAQLEAIKRFSETGGNLISVGGLPIRDEDYVPREESVFTQTNTSSKLGIPPLSILTEYYQNSIRNAHLDPYNRERIISSFGDARQVLTNATSDVGINIFNREPRTIIHLVNYAYNAQNDQMQSKKNIKLKVRVPATNRLTQAESLSPDMEENNNVEFRVEGGYVSFTLPELRTWTVITLQ